MWSAGTVNTKTLAMREGAQGEVSDWFPLADMATELEVSSAPAVTIEATDKQWKRMQLASSACVIISMSALFACIIAGAPPIVGACLFMVMLAGLAVYMWARFKAWWHHG